VFPPDATASDVARSYPVSTATPRPTLIRDVRVFDGTTVLDADSVLVRDGLIAETGTDLPEQDDVEVVEGAGGTLLPGLIDAHTHTMRPAELQQALAFGVTTELDMFCVPSLLGPLREAAAARNDVADIRSAGVGATAAGGHPTQLVEMGVYPPFPTVFRSDEAAAFVADRLGEGSDFVKILIEDGSAMGWDGLAHLDPETVTALVAASHAHRLRAVAHISTQEDARQAVAAGVDGLAHLFVDQPPDLGFARQASEAGIFAIPTLTIFEQLYDNHRRDARYRDHHGLWPYLEPEMRNALLTDWRDDVSWRPPRWASAQHAAHATRLLHQAGVPILAGTDVATPRAAHGMSLHSELAALVDAGLSATEALATATSAPADAFALPDRGRIAPGLRADLLLVAGDPTRDITASAEISGIWRGGHRFDRELYRTGLDPAGSA
jgi:imidazolonepropionase-like amidohydrolase